MRVGMLVYSKLRRDAAMLQTLQTQGTLPVQW
jgi:hypothetical protein